jgi:general secretion pathway protein N
MTAFFKRYPLAAALGIVALVLAAALALEFASGAALKDRVAGTTAPRAAVVQTKLLPSIAAINPDQEYAEMGARPLFTPTRRPAPPAAAAAGASAMAKGQFTLTGVTIAGDTKIALLREKSSGRVVRVEQGKDVNGITVAKIEPEQVTLTQGGDQEVVAMLVSKAGAPPAVPVPPAPAAGPFAPVPGAAPPVQPGVNPAARPAPVPVTQPGAPSALPPGGFGPGGFGPYRPSGPAQPSNPVQDPTTATPPVSQAAPLTPEEILARRRARRNQQ